jgi:hypothetical protein
VSYDLAVWDGERPSGDEEAARTFRALYDRYVDGQPENITPSPAILGYVEALLARHPDLTELADDRPR